MHTVDGQNLPTDLSRNSASSAQLVSVAHREFGLESGAPVHAVHDAPDGPVAIALYHVVAHAEVEDLSAGEEPKGDGEAYFK